MQSIKIFSSLRTRSCIIISVIFSSLSCVSAQIQWAEQVLEKKVGFSEKAVQFRIPFKNKGNSPITLTRTASSCGCAQINQDVLKTYLPNQEDLLVVNYEIGERTGRRIETVYIETNENPKKIYQVKVIVEIPELIRLKPSFLYWKVGDAATPKEIIIQWIASSRGKINVENFTNKDWHISLTSLTDGLSWKLVVTPLSTNEEISLQLPLTLDSPETGSKQVKALAVVQRP